MVVCFVFCSMYGSNEGHILAAEAYVMEVWEEEEPVEKVPIPARAISTSMSSCLIRKRTRRRCGGALAVRHNTLNCTALLTSATFQRSRAD
jgi:hypothetical protein